MRCMNIFAVGGLSKRTRLWSAHNLQPRGTRTNHFVWKEVRQGGRWIDPGLSLPFAFGDMHTLIVIRTKVSDCTYIYMRLPGQDRISDAHPLTTIGFVRRGSRTLTVTESSKLLGAVAPEFESGRLKPSPHLQARNAGGRLRTVRIRRQWWRRQGGTFCSDCGLNARFRDHRRDLSSPNLFPTHEVRSKTPTTRLRNKRAYSVERERRRAGIWYFPNRQ
jgi:hypothetical protein